MSSTGLFSFSQNRCAVLCSFFFSGVEMSLGITTVIVTAIPSLAANTAILVPALGFVEFEMWPKEGLQVDRFFHLLGKISLVR